MILLELFLTFFEIGALTFGGGYAMIPFVREQVLAHGWLTEEELLNMIAVSESTPGPIAVNMATFVGSDQAGILGSAAATLGVVLPSFIIILVISALLKNFLKYKGVGAFLSGVRPCVVSLILGTAITLFLSVLLGIGAGDFELNVDFIGIVIFALVVGISLIYKKKKGKKPSPILMIAISACLGMVLYSLPI
ncbi:MAG: chromate transporter [Clostridia bacterium]|nr:chromate transporter [Clostridia bacterium]